MGNIEIDISSKKVLYGGYIVVGLVFIFLCFFSWINEPIGDDILSYYDGALTFYLDEFEPKLGSQICSFSQILKLIKFVYINWSGRVIGYFLNYFGKMLPKFMQAIYTSTVFILNILLSMKIVYKKWDKTIEHSLTFLILFFVMYWYRCDVYYTYMWTMVTIYSSAVLFCLVYINMAIIDYEVGNRAPAWKLIVIGLVAGSMHEVISFCTIVIVGTKWIIDIIHNKKHVNQIFRHTGLGLGYLLGFFAPGNHHRQMQSHDLITNTYVQRLKLSLLIHKNVLDSNIVGRCIFYVGIIICVCTLVIIVKRSEKTLINLLCDLAPLFLGCICSIFLWAYASHVPEYGLELWILLIYIIIIRVLRENPYKNMYQFYYSFFTIAIMAYFVLVNCSEVYCFAHVSHERRILIREALEQKMKEVEVPFFDQNLSTDRYLISYLNDQKQYDTCYYIDYYGTHIVLSDLGDE